MGQSGCSDINTRCVYFGILSDSSAHPVVKSEYGLEIIQQSALRQSKSKAEISTAAARQRLGTERGQSRLAPEE